LTTGRTLPPWQGLVVLSVCRVSRPMKAIRLSPGPRRRESSECTRTHLLWKAVQVGTLSLFLPCYYRCHLLLLTIASASNGEERRTGRASRTREAIRTPRERRNLLLFLLHHQILLVPLRRRRRARQSLRRRIPPPPRTQSLRQQPGRGTPTSQRRYRHRRQWPWRRRFRTRRETARLREGRPWRKPIQSRTTAQPRTDCWRSRSLRRHRRDCRKEKIPAARAAQNLEILHQTRTRAEMAGKNVEGCCRCLRTGWKAGQIPQGRGCSVWLGCGTAAPRSPGTWREACLPPPPCSGCAAGRSSPTDRGRSRC
jgi:hypothetical protein